MTLKGTVNGDTWVVEAVTSPAPQGGFACHISIRQGGPEQPVCHAFAHHRTLVTETAAMLDGLREGMLWIDLKNRNAFHVQR
ncbi:UDP-glucose 4-epimerase [Paraburkholderia sp. J94]|uniref:UDP-glucose 4-epimerase n=1 Tax=Paraburkholderia sp. J94 TaxID=2805441 RepID=UPI002AB2CB18|nr:UDP-glucose 4-epimerase [Paraburkholderia sp. J94]